VTLTCEIDGRLSWHPARWQGTAELHRHGRCCIHHAVTPAHKRDLLNRPPLTASGTPDLGAGPALAARRFLVKEEGLVAQILTPEQRQKLLDISTLIKAPKGHFFFREGQPAVAVYICRSGAVKTYRDLPSGTRRIKSFLFQRDFFGLAEEGKYVNTARALVPSTCYRIETEALLKVLLSDAGLEFQFLCKLTHEIRESQRRVIMLARPDAIGRLAMFFITLRDRNTESKTRDLVPVPMSRSDIAAYVGHSLETVSRATSRLSKQGLIEFHGRHQVRIVDPVGLERIAANV
jgi:CRP/FNR family transcriptional regulator